MTDLHLVVHPIRDSALQSELHRGGLTTLKIAALPRHEKEEQKHV